MKRRIILSVSLIVLISAFSFLTLTSSERNSILSPTIPSAPLFAGLVFRDNSELLNQSTRMEIYDFAVRNPGTQFRGICNFLNLPVGVAQYHLNLLTKAGLLSVFHDGRYKRYFEPKRFTRTEMTVISVFRHQTAGRILAILTKRPQISHKELALQLKISSQALTWHIKRLSNMGLIQNAREGMKVEYFLDEASALTVRKWVHLIEGK